MHKVKFLKDEGRVLAYFPELDTEESSQTYSEQWSFTLEDGFEGCSEEYQDVLLEADKSEYQKTYNRLYSMGYDMDVLNELKLEDTIPLTYAYIRTKISWETFCDIYGVSYYALKDGWEIKDTEVFSTELSTARKHNLI